MSDLDIPSPDRTPHMWPELHSSAQAAYNQILWEGGMSRAEIARKLGLSRTRLTAITRSLSEVGLIVEGRREQRAATGRPAEMLHAVVDRFHFLGVTISGSRLVAAGVDLRNTVVWEREARIAEHDVQEVVEQVRAWLREARADGLRVAAVAICAPGRSQGESGALDADALRDGLPAFLEGRSIRMPIVTEEDIIALTAYEHWLQLAEGQDDMLLLALGEEIGVGVVTDRRVVVGAHHAAGRFSHVRVGLSGLPCSRGHEDCLWSVCSVPAVLAAVPRAATIAEVSVLAAGGDGPARNALTRAARGAGRAAGIAASLMDPDKVVLAGEVGAAIGGYLEVFGEALAQSGAVTPEIGISAAQSIDWARAAGSYAQYRTLSRRSVI